jgi:hypothetical protein
MLGLASARVGSSTVAAKASAAAAFLNGFLLPAHLIVAAPVLFSSIYLSLALRSSSL